MTHSFPTRLSSDLIRLCLLRYHRNQMYQGTHERFQIQTLGKSNLLANFPTKHGMKGKSFELYGKNSWSLSDCKLFGCGHRCFAAGSIRRSEEHTSELQSLMRISYAVFCLKK